METDSNEFTNHNKTHPVTLAYRTATGSAPSYFHSLINNLHPFKKSEICERASRHHREAQNVSGGKEEESIAGVNNIY